MLVVSSALLFIRGICVKVFRLVSCKEVQSTRFSRPECSHMPTDETAVQVTGRNQAIKI